ncbi:MAG: ATP-binding cassette domain-containing protein [Verrucomicrobiales bacterium]
MSDSAASRGEAPPKVSARHLTMAYGDFVVMRDLDFAVKDEEVFVIMGGSGCGKSTLLKHLIGLLEPAEGEIYYGERRFPGAYGPEGQAMLRNVGVLYQGGALWGERTLAENIALPLEQYTDLDAREIRDLASFKLSLVGLRGFEDFYPSEISGGMRKRAGLARALALDPEILFFDEPSAGLDPLSSRRLDDLILELRDSLGATIIVVTHELDSIFAIADRAIFLDADTRTAWAIGAPRALADDPSNEKVYEFLRRGGNRGPDAP